MANVWSPTFVIGEIRIGQIEGASCVNLGNNWISEFTSYKKQNQGFGDIHGDHSLIRANRSLVNDPDTVDLLGATDSDLPEWLRRLIPTATATEGSSAAG